MKKVIYFLIGVLVIAVAVLTSVFYMKKEKLNIYALNVETENIIVKNILEVKKLSTIEDKITLLTTKLSQEDFEGKTIKFNGIKDESGSKIAHFDLVDTNEKDSWYPYFQGSLGGFSTKLSIVETFLQRDYKGKWIDGIKLSYNGKYEEYDHISFDDTIYWRENTKTRK